MVPSSASLSISPCDEAFWEGTFSSTTSFSGDEGILEELFKEEAEHYFRYNENLFGSHGETTPYCQDCCYQRTKGLTLASSSVIIPLATSMKATNTATTSQKWIEIPEQSLVLEKNQLREREKCSSKVIRSNQECHEEEDRSNDMLFVETPILKLRDKKHEAEMKRHNTSNRCVVGTARNRMSIDASSFEQDLLREQLPEFSDEPELNSTMISPSSSYETVCQGNGSPRKSCFSATSHPGKMNQTERSVEDYEKIATAADKASNEESSRSWGLEQPIEVEEYHCEMNTQAVNENSRNMYLSPNPYLFEPTPFMHVQSAQQEQLRWPTRAHELYEDEPYGIFPPPQVQKWIYPGDTTPPLGATAQSENMMSNYLVQQQSRPGTANMEISQQEPSAPLPLVVTPERPRPPFKKSFSTKRELVVSEDNEEEMMNVPQDYDILLGRGHRTNRHTGNLRFRSLITPFKSFYLSAPTSGKKTAIAQMLVGMCKAPFHYNGRVVMARFLRFHEEQNRWEEVPDAIARRKISHLLRARVRDCNNDSNYHSKKKVTIPSMIAIRHDNENDDDDDMED